MDMLIVERTAAGGFKAIAQKVGTHIPCRHDHIDVEGVLWKVQRVVHWTSYDLLTRYYEVEIGGSYRVVLEVKRYIAY